MSKRAKEKAERIANGIMISVQGKTGRVVYNTKEKSFTHYELMCAAQKGYEQAEKDLGWHPSTEHPPVDEEVIVLTDIITKGGLNAGLGKIAFGHIVDKDIAVDYDGWNIEGVRYWMPMPEIPKEK